MCVHRHDDNLCLLYVCLLILLVSVCLLSFKANVFLSVHHNGHGSVSFQVFVDATFNSTFFFQDLFSSVAFSVSSLLVCSQFIFDAWCDCCMLGGVKLVRVKVDAVGGKSAV